MEEVIKTMTINLSSSPDITHDLSPQLTDLVACNLNNISLPSHPFNLTGQTWILIRIQLTFISDSWHG